MFKLRSLVLAGVIALGTGSSHAVLIVDTGPGPSGPGGYSLRNIDGNYQHLAASFDVASDTVIDRIAGWIGSSDGIGSVEIQLFAGAAPGGTPLYTTSVAGLASAGAWSGQSGLGWSIAAGSYSVAFVAGDGFNGWMSSGVPNPLPPQAYWFTVPLYGGAYVPAGPLNIGLQVAAVPEPGTYGLMALGALAVGAAVRRRRSAAVS